MQRVRIGLTGLACVFLLVVLAASLFGLVGGDSFPEPANQVAAANLAADEPREPLAELGVTPGGAPDEVVNETAPVQPE